MAASTPGIWPAIRLPVAVNVESSTLHSGRRALSSRTSGSAERTSPTDAAWIHSGFAEAQIIHAYANCRPAFADNLPRIDSCSNESGVPLLLRVNGLYRHGYLLGPLVLNLALAALEGRVTHPIVRSANNLPAENLQVVNAR